MSYFLGTKAATYVVSTATNFLAGEGEEGTEVQHNNGLNQLRLTEEQYVFGKLMRFKWIKKPFQGQLHMFAKKILLLSGPELAFKPFLC